MAKREDKPPSTVVRLADALTAHGFLARGADGRYRLGRRLLLLALTDPVVFNLRPAALPLIEHLVDRSSETVVLSVLAGSARVYIEQVESPQPVRRVIELNSPPLHVGASGKSLLAWLPEGQVLDLAGTGTLAKFIDRTITDVRDSLLELAEVRKKGYAVR